MQKEAQSRSLLLHVSLQNPYDTEALYFFHVTLKDMVADFCIM